MLRTDLSSIPKLGLTVSKIGEKFHGHASGLPKCMALYAASSSGGKCWDMRKSKGKVMEFIRVFWVNVSSQWNSNIGKWVCGGVKRDRSTVGCKQSILTYEVDDQTLD